MNNRFLILFVALTVVFSLAVVPATTLAQSDSTPTPEDGEEPADSEISDDSNQDQDFEFVFSDSLQLVNSHWGGDTFIAKFQAEKPTQVVVTDAGRESKGNENIIVKRETYTIASKGTTTIQFTVEEDRQVTIDDGNTLLLKGDSSGGISFPSASETITLILGVVSVVFLVPATKLVGDRQARKTDKRVF